MGQHAKSSVKRAKNKVYASMAQAAAALHVSSDLLRAAKKAGCSAFRSNNSIDGGELSKWLKDPANLSTLEASTSYRDKKIFEEWRKLKIANDAKENALVPRAAVAASITAVGAKLRENLTQKLLNEYPAAVAGLDVPQARIYGNRLIAAMMEDWQKFTELWPA